MYPQILDLHQHYYKTNDPKEEGLWIISYSKKDLLFPILFDEKILEKADTLKVQDPLFNTLLIWSNEALINIGGTLNEDVSEIMGWHERGIHTMNAKLWNENLCAYQAYDVVNNQQIKTEKVASFIPFAAGIPGIDEAFYMIDILFYEENFAEEFPLLKWMMCQGLPLYEEDGFLEFAAKLEKETFQSFKNEEQNRLEMAVWGID